MSLRLALLKCFQAEPTRVFSTQDLCVAVEAYYEFSTFQRERDPKHLQPRFHHEVRSQRNRLKQTGYVIHLGYNQWRLA